MRSITLIIAVFVFFGCGEKSIHDYTMGEIQADSTIRKRCQTELPENDRLYIGLQFMAMDFNMDEWKDVTLGEILKKRDEKRVKAMQYTIRQMIDDENISKEISVVLSQAEKDTIYARSVQYGYRGDTATFFNLTVQQALK